MNNERTKALFGDDFARVRDLKILILGAGGVGGYAALGLWRSGLRNLSIVDYDVFELSNQNRQIGSEFVGEKKVEVLARKFAKLALRISAKDKYNICVSGSFLFDGKGKRLHPRKEVSAVIRLIVIILLVLVIVSELH